MMSEALALETLRLAEHISRIQVEDLDQSEASKADRAKGIGLPKDLAAILRADAEEALGCLPANEGGT